MSENKIHRIKNRFIRIQEKLQDRMDEFQDQVQNKIEKSKISKFISHLSEDRNSVDSFESADKSSSDGDIGSEYLSVPSFVIDKPEDRDVKDTCKNFINIEQGGLYKSVSACNLAYDENRNSYSSSDSCFSCLSSSDERDRQTGIRPRAGSLPPGTTALVQPSPGTCTDLIEKLGNHFPRLKSQGDRIHRYLLKNTRLSDVNKRLKAQIWSSVVTIVLVEAKNLPAMDLDTRSSDPYCKFRLGNEKYKSKVVWKSLNPSWLEQFDLHLYDDQEQILEVTVWDKDKQTKDDFLGRCSIDLSRLEREKTHNIRKDLEDGNGQIFLLLTISGTTQSETITDLSSYKENPRDLEIIERRYTWYHMNEQSSGVGWLCVKVYGAKGLAAADLGGKSDPFCVLELGNARLQTHTEYKTLTPNWMKIFTFTVKDISSILEITVYDEDHDHKVEFLGKLAVPLLNIRNGEKRWYALKDKKMRARAKGNYPQILLEMLVIWNPLKAAIRAVNPKEPKYMYQEAKFKRQLFIRNVMRLKAIIMWFIEVGKILQDCFEWESRIRSFLGLLMWLAFCYYYEMWMLPFLILMFLGRNWLIYRLTGGNPLLVPVDDEDLLAEEDDEDEADKEEKKSLKERLQAIQEVTQTVQNAIGYVAALGESVKNLMNFTVPYLSYLAIIMLFGAMVVLYMIPLRYLLMAWGINKFTRKILRPHTIPNNEVLDLLSRVPDDETLLDCRELKPHPPNEHRRDARKKHKAS
ncbi:multiple C2 and transmembrane domain-containing protein-like isoform X7 [Trichoplusia ni]|uniref:Multiple C2 and transmembrane domain-containing protein-like isoform X7 n=1 Tax=Trichoplusia ni TaxID=7111 RepID=A0A7E5VPR7_TRINI|nr:multiple C2 and transmembrane domain-containing protein-like isoform X7 [Trichoplusia ni]